MLRTCLYLLIYHAQSFFSIVTFFFTLLLWWVGAHCGICTGSYNASNISYMNSPPQPFSFFSPSLYYWSSFNTYHFCIYLHVYTFYCTVFILLPLFPHTYPPPTGASPPTLGRTFSNLLFSDFVGEKKRKHKTKNMTF
jgi:hypothetical protein